MKHFIITRSKNVTQEMAIEAESQADAQRRIENNEGTYVDSADTAWVLDGIKEISARKFKTIRSD